MTSVQSPDMMLRTEDMRVTYLGYVFALRPTTAGFYNGDLRVAFHEFGGRA